MEAIADALLGSLNRFNKGIFQELSAARKHKLRIAPHPRTANCSFFPSKLVISTCPFVQYE
jgi:hypothetical protein